MNVGNCLIFAIALYCRRHGCGNRRTVSMRRKRGSILPHFMYLEQRAGRDRLVHYVPNAGGDSASAPLFRGWVKWGDRALPGRDQDVAASVIHLRQWARYAGPKDITWVSTKYGCLAFFRDQIDSVHGDHWLEEILQERIDEARADHEGRTGALPKIQHKRRKN